MSFYPEKWGPKLSRKNEESGPSHAGCTTTTTSWSLLAATLWMVLLCLAVDGNQIHQKLFSMKVPAYLRSFYISSLNKLLPDGPRKSRLLLGRWGRRRPNLMTRPPRTITTIANSIPEGKNVPRFMRITTSRALQLDGVPESKHSPTAVGPHSPGSTARQRAQKLNRGKPMVVKTIPDSPFKASKNSTRRRLSPSPLRKTAPSTLRKASPSPLRNSSPSTRRQQQNRSTPSSRPTTKRKPSPSPARSATGRQRTPQNNAGSAPPLRSSSPFKSKESPLRKRITPTTSSVTPIASNKKKTHKITTPSASNRKNARQMETRSPLETTEQKDAPHYLQRESPSIDGNAIIAASQPQQSTNLEAVSKPDPEPCSPETRSDRPDPDGDQRPTTGGKSRSLHSMNASPVVGGRPSSSQRATSPALRSLSPQSNIPATATGSAVTQEQALSIKSPRSKTPQPNRQPQQKPSQSQTRNQKTASPAKLNGAASQRKLQGEPTPPPKILRVTQSTERLTPNNGAAATHTNSASPAQTHSPPRSKPGTSTGRNGARNAKKNQSSLMRPTTAFNSKVEPMKTKPQGRKPAAKPKPVETPIPTTATRRRKSRLPPLPSFRESPPSPTKPQLKQNGPTTTPTEKKSPLAMGKKPLTKKSSPLPRNSPATARNVGKTPQIKASAPLHAPKKVTKTQPKDVPQRAPKNPDGRKADPSPRKVSTRNKKKQDPPTFKAYPRRAGRIYGRAAIRLQAFVRMQILRRKFLLLRSAMILIQSQWRHNVFKLSITGTRLQHFSCLVIQSNYRMFSCRASYVQLRNTVVVLQAAARMFSCRSAYIELRSASQKLLGRKSVVRPPLTPTSHVTVKGGRLRIYSAVLIQSLVRMRWVWAAYFELRSSALVLQRWFRKMGKVLKVQNKAAIVVQKWVRMLSWRRCFLDLRKSAIKMQSFNRMVGVRLRYLAEKQIRLEDTSAILIQSFYRRDVCRDAYNQLQISVMVIQQWARAVVSRKCYETEQRAAITVQCWARQINSERLVLRTICARLIQACYRGYSAHNAFTKQRVCASMIQAVVRGCMHRVRFFFLKIAVTIVQKNRRRKMVLSAARIAWEATNFARSENLESSGTLASDKAPAPIFLRRRGSMKEDKRSSSSSNEASEASESTPDPSETSLTPNNSITASVASSSISSDDMSPEAGGSDPTPFAKPAPSPSSHNAKQTPEYDDVMSAALAFVSQGQSQNSRKAKELLLSPKETQDDSFGTPKAAAGPSTPTDSKLGYSFVQEISQSKEEIEVSATVKQHERRRLLERRKQREQNLDASSEEDSIDAPPSPERHKRQTTTDHHKKQSEATSATLPTIDMPRDQHVPFVDHSQSNHSIRETAINSATASSEERLREVVNVRDPVGHNMSRQRSGKEEPPTPAGWRAPGATTANAHYPSLAASQGLVPAHLESSLPSLSDTHQALASNHVAAPKLAPVELSPSQQPIYFVSGLPSKRSDESPQLYTLQPVGDLRSQQESRDESLYLAPADQLGKKTAGSSPFEEKKGRKDSILEGLMKERKRKTSFEKNVLSLTKTFPAQSHSISLPSTNEKSTKLKDYRRKSSDPELKATLIPDLYGPKTSLFGRDETDLYYMSSSNNSRSLVEDVPSIAENPSYYLPKTEIKTPRPRERREDEYSEKAISEKLAAIKKKTRARKVQKWTKRTQKHQARDDSQTERGSRGDGKQKRDFLDVAVEHWEKQTGLRRRLSVVTSGMDGEFATTIQSAWRSHRDQIALAAALLHTWSVICEFSPDTMNNDRILRLTANILALDGAFGQVGYHWQNGITISKKGLVTVDWEGLAPVSFSEHGLPTEDTCGSVSVHCTAREGPLLASWSARKRRILLTKAAIEKYCDEQRHKLRKSSIFVRSRHNIQSEKRAKFRVEAQTRDSGVQFSPSSAAVIQNTVRQFQSAAGDDAGALGVPNDFQERMRSYSAVLIQSWYRMCVCRSMFQGLRRIQSTVLLILDRDDVEVETIKFHRCFEPRQFETILEEGFECTTGSTES